MRRRSDMEIIKAKAGDVPSIAALEKLCFSVPWSEKAIAETMARDETLFLVARDGEETVGYIGSYYCFSDGYITNVAVAPKHRRCGIGKALIGELIARGKEMKLSFLSLEVRKSNVAAISLYKALGFKEAGLRPGFYSEPVEDAYIMTYYIEEQSDNL